MALWIPGIYTVFCVDIIRRVFRSLLESHKLDCWHYWQLEMHPKHDSDRWRSHSKWRIWDNKPCPEAKFSVDLACWGSRFWLDLWPRGFLSVATSQNEFEINRLSLEGTKKNPRGAGTFIFAVIHDIRVNPDWVARPTPIHDRGLWEVVSHRRGSVQIEWKNEAGSGRSAQRAPGIVMMAPSDSYVV